jgi:hypothetical protein
LGDEITGSSSVYFTPENDHEKTRNDSYWFNLLACHTEKSVYAITLAICIQEMPGTKLCPLSHDHLLLTALSFSGISR